MPEKPTCPKCGVKFHPAYLKRHQASCKGKPNLPAEQNTTKLMTKEEAELTPPPLVEPEGEVPTSPIMKITQDIPAQDTSKKPVSVPAIRTMPPVPVEAPKEPVEARKDPIPVDTPISDTEEEEPAGVGFNVSYTFTNIKELVRADYIILASFEGIEGEIEITFYGEVEILSVPTKKLTTLAIMDTSGIFRPVPFMEGFKGVRTIKQEDPIDTMDDYPVEPEEPIEPVEAPPEAPPEAPVIRPPPDTNKSILSRLKNLR